MKDLIEKIHKEVSRLVAAEAGPDVVLFTDVMSVLESVFTPIPMLLWCPQCGERHIDADDAPEHKTHACQDCGMLWRPTLISTRGVLFLPGCKDENNGDRRGD